MFWKIRDAGEFLFRVDEPEAAVKIAAEGALRDIISRTPIQAAMSNQRQQIAEETRALLQKLLDTAQSGVEITQVQLLRVEPPLAVIDAFNDVQRALADQERARNEAQAYANDILPRARGEAEHTRQDAEAYRGFGRRARRRRGQGVSRRARRLSVRAGRHLLAALHGGGRRDAEEGVDGC